MNVAAFSLVPISVYHRPHHPPPISLPHCPKVTFLRKLSGHIPLSLHQKKKSQMTSGEKTPKLFNTAHKLSIISAQASSPKPFPASVQSTPDFLVTWNLKRSQSISCVWMLTVLFSLPIMITFFPLSWGALSHLDDSAQT